jgi:uncharacterized protein YjcR
LTLTSKQKKGEKSKKNESEETERATKNAPKNAAPKTNTTAAKSGAPIGNKNAVGNPGGLGGPPGNKKALTTGEHETIEFSHITGETEAALLDEPFDKYAEQEKLIKTDRVRRYRMMKRIEAAENTPGGMMVDTVTKEKGTNVGKHHDTIQTVVESSQKRILQIEDALSRVIAGAQRGIANWHKMEIDDAKQSQAAADEVLDGWLDGVDGDWDCLREAAPRQGAGRPASERSEREDGLEEDI